MPKAASQTIIHVAAGLNQGGTARAIEVLALEGDGPPGQRVFALGGLGPVGDRLRARGVETRGYGSDPAKAAAAIRKLAPATLILHRAGRPEARWHRLLEALEGADLTIVDFNVFGWVDEEAIRRGLKGVYCVSGSALAKYLRLTFGCWPSMSALAAMPIAVCAGHNPLGEDDFRDPEPQADARRALGLPLHGPIAIRTGRPDWRKWSDLAILHSKRLLAQIPDLTFVFLSAPENRRPIIARELGSRAIVPPFSSDPPLIRRYMSAADLMIHHARYGESFGYALAEAQGMGLPVVVQSTPWGDNAQAEIVRHGETGFVVNRYGEMRLYVERLIRDPDLRRRIGTAARSHARASFGAGPTWHLLRRFIDAAAAGEGGLVAADEALGTSQFVALARGMASYSERYPLALRLAEEAPLYGRPWFWSTLASDVIGTVRQRLRSARSRAPR
jgi:glycosyltransferase involved in cell wall biosynthesis